MDNKKYFVRIRLCQTGLYYVQFAHYKRRFFRITIWHTVTRFSRPPYAYEHTCSGWENKIFNYRDAENFAKSIDTYEKLNKYYENENHRYQEYLKSQSKRDNDSTPYKTKYI